MKTATLTEIAMIHKIVIQGYPTTSVALEATSKWKTNMLLAYWETMELWQNQQVRKRKLECEDFVLAGLPELTKVWRPMMGPVKSLLAPAPADEILKDWKMLPKNSYCFSLMLLQKCFLLGGALKGLWQERVSDNFQMTSLTWGRIYRTVTETLMDS